MINDSKQSTLSQQRLGPLHAESLTELAYRSIKESIISGHFDAGEQLIESQLAKELGISRAPIREAMMRLKGDRLVVERPRQGTFVREFTAQDIVDLFNLRVAIESTAIRLVMRKGYSPEPLDDIIKEMTKAAEEQDAQALVETELRFHEVLCQASSNEYIISVFHLLAAQIRMAFAMENKKYINLAAIADEHIPVVESIRSGDELSAVTAIEHHIIASVSSFLESLEADVTGLLGSLFKK